MNPMTVNHASAFILVVEDDALLRQALQDILKIAGYRVRTAADARDGLRILETADRMPDVIVSDFGLPGMNGDQFLERLQANLSWRHIPFIFVSGSREDLTSSWISWEPNVVACLPKPFPIQDLLDAVAQATSAARTR
jgi:CheY-like chemotaxis protein